MIFTQENHPINGLYPAADAFSGTVYTDIVSLGNAKHITFLLSKGVGTTGTSTLTVEACSTVAASATTAIAFQYKKCSSSTSEDTFGPLTEVTSAGFTTSAGSNEIYAIEVDAAAVIATGYEFVRLKCVEVADDPVLGGITIILSGLRVQGDTLPESIS
jgi:hypothetical protein